MLTWNLIDCLDDLKAIVNCDFLVNFCLFCLRYGHVIRVLASGRFITLAMTYGGDVYFVPVLYPFFMIILVGIL
ncbi:hypothetical protein SLEP1_g59608 [Rubroshorea leprosula]|uniref:Uncharacterized protein n=1 Tax=Rubroshorea leprosula TaxID=152421 RepID=A0AAV5MU43_9ROSI|nr:hypothetical protein SLEP1_g59608 [Rubroshorea leprosula]